jgi:hypothetical protein
MLDFNDFAPLCDFSLVENAVQAFFCADALGASFVAPKNDDDPARESWTAGDGNIAFYTAFQALTFQKCRPRVWFSALNFNPVPGAYAVDANGNLREKAWTGTARLSVLTEANYLFHTALRARVLAIIPQVIGQVAPDNSLFATTGANALLDFHQLSNFSVQNAATTVTPEQDAYRSDIPISLAFQVRPDKWPAGMITV